METSLALPSTLEAHTTSNAQFQLNRFRWSAGDLAYVALIWTAIIVGIIRQNEVYALWFDELLSYNSITDPSAVHMLAALGDQADGGAPLYYLLARVWASSFGATEISLRLFSGVFFGAGATILWVLLRRVFPRWVCAVAISCALGSSALVRFEAANARFYGLLFALFSLGLFIAQELLATQKPRRLLLFGNIIVNAALVLTHPFGICYSGLLMVGIAIADWKMIRRVRLNIVTSYFIAWCAVLLWVKQFIHQGGLNDPFTWARKPGLFDLPTSLDAGGDYGLIAIVILLLLLHRGGAVCRPNIKPRAIGTAIVGLTTLAIIPVLWLFSRIFPEKSVFVDRYFTGCVAAWAIILGTLLSVIDNVPQRLKAYLLGLAVLLLSPLVTLYRGEFPKLSDVAVPDVDVVGGRQLPILMLNSQWYLQRHHYGPNKSRYFYPLDWQAMLRDNPTKKPLFDAPTNYKLMSGVKRNYPEFRNIIPIEEFLAREPRFLVYGLNREWRALRLPTSEYEVTIAEPVVKSDRQPEYFLVQKRTLVKHGPSISSPMHAASSGSKQ